VITRPLDARPRTLAFVIPVRNDADRLARCLNAISANDSAGLVTECFVADNGSTDRSADVARAAGARVLSYPSLSVAALRNRAAATADSDLLAFVDADHEIVPVWLAAVASVFAERTVGAAGALYQSPPAGTWTQRLYGALRGRTVGHADTLWLGSGNLVVRRHLFEALGGFDERLQTCEDVDLCQRLRAAGARIVADERLASVHFGDPKTLRELFLAERWRGRDNLRVSLRVRPGLRDLPSIAIPVFDAMCLLLAGVGLLATPFVGRAAFVLSLSSLVAIGGLSVLRAIRMSAQSGLVGIANWLRAFAVALVYDLARACSLVLPAGHRRQKRQVGGLAPGPTS
jgi:GT2 family glycosyltransferase